MGREMGFWVGGSAADLYYDYTATLVSGWIIRKSVRNSDAAHTVSSRGQSCVPQGRTDVNILTDAITKILHLSPSGLQASQSYRQNELSAEQISEILQWKKKIKNY